MTFQPAGIKINDISDAIKILDKVDPSMKALGRGNVPINEGLYPWDWVKSEVPNFKSLQGGLLVAPILQKLIFNRDPQRIVAWVKRVSSWNFSRIIPCHLSNNIKATPQNFKEAFDFLYEPAPKSNFPFQVSNRLPRVQDDDGKLLNDISVQLTKQGTLFPEAPKLKR